jgi:hypothetical protein
MIDLRDSLRSLPWMGRARFLASLGMTVRGSERQGSNKRWFRGSNLLKDSHGIHDANANQARRSRQDR